MAGKPRPRIKCEWSTNIAYAVGLITSDGSLCRNRTINLTSKDYQLVDLFKKCLGVNNAISKKSRGSESQKKYYVVQIGDVIFYRWLLTAGLSPNKSKTIGAIRVPEMYYADFIRGVFDGDGTVWSSRDKRWRSSWVIASGFCSASPVFLEWLQKKNMQLIGIRGGLYASTRVMQLRYSKKESALLRDFMYYDSGLPYLKRKYDKFLAILPRTA